MLAGAERINNLISPNIIITLLSIPSTLSFLSHPCLGKFFFIRLNASVLRKNSLQTGHMRLLVQRPGAFVRVLFNEGRLGFSALLATATQTLSPLCALFCPPTSYVFFFFFFFLPFSSRHWPTLQPWSSGVCQTKKRGSRMRCLNKV